MKSFLMICLLICSLTAVAHAVATATSKQQASVPISIDDFNDKTQAKTVFIKYYAPWCGHCQNLAPIWEQLAADWVGHPQGLVAEVDCTTNAEVEKWCSKHFGLNGFPTLLYGDASHDGVLLKEYNGDKTYEALSEFANATLSTPFCSPANVDACDKATKRRLQSYLKLSPEKLEQEEKALYKQMDDANDKFNKEFDKMQATYDETKQTHELFAAKQKRLLKEMKAVLKEKRKQEASK